MCLLVLPAWAVAGLNKEAMLTQVASVGTLAVMTTAFTCWWLLRKKIIFETRTGILWRAFPARWLVVAMLTAFFFAWGQKVSAGRLDAWDLPNWLQYQFWGCVLLAALIFRLRASNEAVIYGFVLLPLFLLPPLSSGLGFPAIGGPVWITWLIFVTFQGLRQELDWRQVLILCVAIFLFVQPFFLIEAKNLRFFRFMALSPELEPSTVTGNCVFSLGASLGIFARRFIDKLANGLAGLFWLYFLCIFFRVLPPEDPGNLFVVGLLGIASLACFYLGRNETASHWSRRLLKPLLLMALISIFFYTVHVTSIERLQFIMVLAALRLSSYLVSVLGLNDEPVHRQILTILAVLFCGWLTVGWRADNLELDFLYRFFNVSTLEQHSFWFVVIVAVRFALPVLITRLVVEFDRPSQGLRRSKERLEFSATHILGCKFASLVVMTLGMRTSSPASPLYLEGLQHQTVLALLSLGLF